MVIILGKGFNSRKVFSAEEIVDIKLKYVTMSATEIANIYKLNSSNIIHMLKSNGVNIRGRKESQQLYLKLHNERSKKQSIFMKQNNPMTNVEYRKKCSQPGKLNGMYGKTHLVGDLNPTKRPEVREKISKSMAKAIANGGGYTRNTIRGYYKDEHYDSSWELLYMKYLEKNNINWTKKHKIIIPYIWENITHNYVPDFLINDNEIHEVKPLFRLKDKQTFEKIRAGEKWCNQHGYIFKLIADSTIEKLKSAEVI